MKVLITGLNNYLARNITVCLAEEGYQVSCMIRNKNFFYKHVPEKYGIEVIEGDLLRNDRPLEFDAEIGAAFYFNQSPVSELDIRTGMELLALQRYIQALKSTACEHLVYVTKLVDDHVSDIESYIRESGMNYTIVRVSNIIGKGSVLMNILSKLGKQRLVMISNEFAKSRCQPIHLLDVCAYLNHIILDRRTYGKTYDIGGPEIMTYQEVFERYLEVIKKRKRILPLPALGTTLTRWMARFLYQFEQDVSAAFTTNMHQDLLCEKVGLTALYPIELTAFDAAVNLALGRTETGHSPNR